MLPRGVKPSQHSFMFHFTGAIHNDQFRGLSSPAKRGSDEATKCRLERIAVSICIEDIAADHRDHAT